MNSRPVWIERSGRTSNFDPNQHKFMCDAHFNPGDLCPNYTFMKTTLANYKGLPRLKKDAMPTRNLPIQEQVSKQVEPEQIECKFDEYMQLKRIFYVKNKFTKNLKGDVLPQVDQDGYIPAAGPVLPIQHEVGNETMTHTNEAVSPPKKRKREIAMNPGYVNWNDVSGVSDEFFQHDISEVEQLKLNQSSYIPSNSSVMEAQQELGPEPEGYAEYENGGGEIPGPISDDVENVEVSYTGGYVLMDLAILIGLISQFCFKCKSTISTVNQKKTGAMLTFTVLCCKGHTRIIRTQNLVYTQPEGNVLLANAILASGMTFAVWRRFCIALQMPTISNTTFYSLISKFIKPVVFSVWHAARKTTLAALEIGNDISKFVADGQFDSAGYCAKYLIETVMCANTGRIIDFIIYQKGIDKGEMESKGLRFLLNRLVKELGKNIGTLCTDRNPSVQKMMRVEFPGISHQYDIWHLAKGLKKKMKKNFIKFPNLLAWSKSISNHLWWCSQTCAGSADNLLAKWRNLLMHLRNQHTHCEHTELAPEESRKKAWILENSDVKKMRSLIEDTRLNNDLKKCTEFVHTGNLESLHSKANIYRPKKYHFSYEGMVLRTCIAYLDHNANLNKAIVSQVNSV